MKCGCTVVAMVIGDGGVVVAMVFGQGSIMKESMKLEPWFWG